MMLSLRQLACSHRLRAMGVLAWLMLVIQSVAAVPSTNMPVASHARPVHTQVATAEHHAHGCLIAAASTAASCCQHPADGCGGSTGPCACTAACATADLPRVSLAVPPAEVGVVHALPPQLAAPAGANALPLRPPAA
jgi:hypothetical protein